MANRLDYLEYLSEQGLTEDDVLPVVNEDYKDNTKKKLFSVETALLVAQLAKDAASGNRESMDLLEKMGDISKMLDGNTNLFLELVIQKNLHKHCEMAKINLPSEIYVGIFPTNSYNAKAIAKSSGYMALITTGLVEIIEAVVEFSCYDLSIVQKANQIRYWLEDYLRNNNLPSIQERQKISQVNKEKIKDIRSYLITAAEEFIVLHEYGHCALGHFLNNGTKQKQFIELSYEKEFHADLWALNIQIQKSNAFADEYMRAIKIFGFYATLSIEALLRNLSENIYGMKYPDTHPASALRIWNLEAYLKTLGYLEDCYLGFEFLKVIDKISEQLFANTFSDKIPVFDPAIIRTMDRFIENNKIKYKAPKWYQKFL